MQFDNHVIFDPKIPKHKPIFTKILLVLILTMFIVEIYFNALYSDKAIIILGAKWNEGIRHGQYWRFITSTFLHGNFFHLFLNMMAIYIFGQELESIFGKIRFILLIFLSSWGATLSSYIFSPNTAIGASGLVFGIIGATMVFFYKQREELSGAILKFKAMYTIAVINLICGFILPKIDNYAHIGGLITGMTLSWFISPEYKIEKDETNNKLTVTEKTETPIATCGTLLVTLILYFISKNSTH